MSSAPSETEDEGAVGAAQGLSASDGLIDEGGSSGPYFPDGGDGGSRNTPPPLPPGAGGPPGGGGGSLFDDGVGWLERELAASTDDPRRAARLLHEIGHFKETRLGRQREAAKIYAQSLTTDPTLEANAWVLRRAFRGRAMWDNLVRLLDAEIRFAVLPTLSDRADLHVERGRILEDRLNRDADAQAAYRAALEASPGHPAALLALALLALRTSDWQTAQDALGELFEPVTDPTLRALFTVEIARLDYARADGGPVTVDAIRTTAEALMRAVPPTPGASEVLLEELDRLSQLPDGADLRTRVLDIFDSRMSRDESAERLGRPRAVALYREKARALQKRGSRDAALAVIERALSVEPNHPLLIGDLLDMAEDAGRADVLAAGIAAAEPALSPDELDEARLRLGEASARSGALGEALVTLMRIEPTSRYATLAAFARARVLARIGDAKGLADLFASEARRVLEKGEAEAGLDEPARRREAAHLLVRAAVIRLELLKDHAAAEAELREALALEPGYAPAVEAYRAVLAEGERWLELADLLESELKRASEGERQKALRAGLRQLHRDVLGDPVKAASFDDPAGPEASLEEAVMSVDARGREHVAGAGAAEALADALAGIAERCAQTPVAAALKLAAARILLPTQDASARRAEGVLLSPQPDQDERAAALLREAFELDPGSAAAGTLVARALRPRPEPGSEAAGQGGATEEIERILHRELASVEDRDASDVARALRFRIAFLALEGGRYGDAVAILDPLRKADDGFALAWSLEIARESKDPHLEAGVLHDLEAAEAASIEAAGGTPAPAARMLTRFEQLRTLAEALERGGDRESAATAFATAAELSSGVAVNVALDAALGLLRTRGARTSGTDTANATRRIADLLQGWPVYSGARRAAEWLALAAGERVDPLSKPAETSGDALTRWLAGVRKEDPVLTDAGLAELAKGAGDHAGEILAVVAARKALAGAPDAGDALATASAQGAGGATAVAATDLTNVGEGNKYDLVAALREARAQRLLDEGGSGRELALRLLHDQARGAEQRGRLKTAAGVYAKLIALHPSSLDATEGLRRVARAIGDRRLEAAILARLGGLLFDPKRAAERFAEAALLLEDEGLPEAAARQFLAVLERAPEDDEAFLRLKRILEKRADFAGLERLLGFKIAHTKDPATKAGLYVNRATVRLDRLGRRHEAIQDLRRALARDPGRVEALRTLARLASEDGRFAVAADVLGRALENEKDEAVRVGIRLDRAAALERSGQAQKALETLGQAVDEAPEAPEPRERLIELAIRVGENRLAADQLRALESWAADSDIRASYQLRRARLERDQRQNAAEAVEILVETLELDPLGEAPAELLRTVDGGARLSPSDEARIKRVLEAAVTTLALDPLDVARLQSSRDLARLLLETDFAEAVGQLLSLLGVDAERGRTRDVTRPLAPGTFTSLMPEHERARAALLFEVWPIVAPAAARVDAPEPSDFGASRGTRIAPGVDRRLAWIETTARALGIEGLTLHVTGIDDLAVVALDAADPCLIIGRGIVSGDSTSRFLVGRALFLLRQRSAGLLRWTQAEIVRVWDAVARLCDPESARGSEPGDLKGVLKTLNKALSRRDLKTLETFGSRFQLGREPRDLASWKRSLIGGGNRLGYLMAGDLAAALRAILGIPAGQPPPPVEDLRKAESLDLIRFALSSEPAVVRREGGFGVGGRGG